jgi:hypothetical protein
MQDGHHAQDTELRRFPPCLWRDSDPDNTGPDEI